MNKKDVIQKLERHGIRMKHPGDYLTEGLVEDYLKNYGHIKVGTQLELIVDKETIKDEVKRRFQVWNIEFGEYVIEHEEMFFSEWERYEKFIDKDSFVVDTLYNLGAVHLVGFEDGMELRHFKAIDMRPDEKRDLQLIIFDKNGSSTSTKLLISPNNLRELMSQHNEIKFSDSLVIHDPEINERDSDFATDVAVIVCSDEFEVANANKCIICSSIDDVKPIKDKHICKVCRVDMKGLNVV